MQHAPEPSSHGLSQGSSADSAWLAPGVDTLTHRKMQPAQKAQAFTPLVVMEFGRKVPQCAVEWIEAKLVEGRSFGGGELLVRARHTDTKMGATLYVGATTERLLLAAELMEIKKPYKDGSLREVSTTDLQLFHNSDDLDNFFSVAEKQRIIQHEAECIRASETERDVPGLPKVLLYKGEAIIAKCQEEHVITKVFPLHSREELKVLGKEWYQAIIRTQPIEKIHDYFGETIAMYFAFLGYYTMALIPPAFIGTISAFNQGAGHLPLDLVIFFSIFNLVWATLFLEAWKRTCSALAYRWGTMGMEPFEEARASYHGTLGVNKVTGRLEPRYPKWKRVLKFYGVSVPVVLLCLFVAFLVMLWYFWMEQLAVGFHKSHQSTLSGVLLHAPTVLYAIVIIVMNGLYRTLAKALNDWENHRLHSAYENHLIVKLVLFDFVNCFMSLFYVAFYLQDMALLRSHVAALLITSQVLGQFVETLLPYLLYKWRKTGIRSRHNQRRVGDTAIQEADTEHVFERAELESSKEEYPGILDDYLELFLQFGYVFLFASVFPTAAFWALLNNVTEIRSDAFKMCRVFRRPFAKATAGIGAWQIAFEMMSCIAVMTNCALIAMQPQTKSFMPDYSEATFIMVFVLAEHVILFVKLMISYLIPDEPEWVQTAISKVEFQAKHAWRSQRLQEAQVQLRQRSQSQLDYEVKTQVTDISKQD